MPTSLASPVESANALPCSTRREFLRCTALGIAGLAAGAAGFTNAADQAAPASGQKERKLRVCLSPGLIGVRANLNETIELAVQQGFEAIEPPAGELASLSDDAMAKLQETLKTKGLVWGAAGVGSPFSSSEEEYKAWMEKLPGITKALQRAGARRVATWLLPGDNRLTYRENFRRHLERARAIAKVMDDHGLSFGLEYVGPKTGWTRSRYPFIHTMKEMRELIAEAGNRNLGLLLDSWHWYTAGETVADLRSLRNEEIVAVHLNDAPSGVAVDQQVDNKRALPASTGVIDIVGFLGGLIAIGYDGPAAAEPFDPELGRMPREQAVRKTSEAIRAALQRQP
jgi:sugar phosphate isomerase/epimerase